MERNVGELLIGGFAVVIACNGVLECLIWGAVVHHFAVDLGEDPVVSLPIVSDL